MPIAPLHGTRSETRAVSRKHPYSQCKPRNHTATAPVAAPPLALLVSALLNTSEHPPIASPAKKTLAPPVSTAPYAYDSSFFDHTTRVSIDSARKVVSVIQRLIPVRSVLDAGCAQGAWLSVWRDAGVAEYKGLDGDYVDRARMLIDPAHFTPHDLTRPFSLGRRFDLAQSLEVAEHLPASRAAGFVEDLTSHADAVLFSAAPPGQGGENHIHERPYEFWRDLFAARGYSLYDCVRPLVRDDADVAPWYRHNVFLFLNAEAEKNLPPYAALFRVPDGAPITDVSDPVYKARKEVIRRLPFWATQLLAKAKARVLTGTG